MVCPECEKQGLVSLFYAGASKPGSPRTRVYYDELGQEHVHTHGKTQPHWCSQGHKFKCTWEEVCSLNTARWNYSYGYGESDTEMSPWCEDLEAERLEIEAPDTVVTAVGRWLTNLYAGLCR